MKTIYTIPRCGEKCALAAHCSLKDGERPPRIRIEVERNYLDVACEDWQEAKPE